MTQATNPTDVAIVELESSFDTFQITTAVSPNEEPTSKKNKNGEDEDLQPQCFGLSTFQPPPLLCRHPEPYSGRDDDPVKLKEIMSDIMVKLGIYSENPDMSTRILFGIDHKIGKNLLCLMKQRRYAPFLPEFPCLHARKSRITILFSAYKQAGIHSVHSTVVERATYMRVYAGSSPTGADHRKELKSALSCSLNDVK